jgi:CDP-diacylglycerol--serine O-phosphatidyltransferase
MTETKETRNDTNDTTIEKEKTSSIQARRGRHLLPHLITTTALFSAFYAIVAAMKGQFNIAAIAIFIAMLADTLDGRIARLTGTMSAFGAEYDSLSDMVAFGVAPALVMYHWGLHFLGKIGWLMAFCYVAATALRLARFNVCSSGKRFFHGLPCTLAAGVMAGFVWVQEVYPIAAADGYIRVGPLNLIASVITVSLAILMVSNFRYRSYKDGIFKETVSYVKIPLIILPFIAVAIDPPKVLFAVFSMYALTGPMTAVIHYVKKWWAGRKVNTLNNAETE